MELLPPTGWADVATKHDLAHQTEVLNSRTDSRFGVLDARITTEVSGVRTEIADVRIELADLRTELHKTLRMHTLVTVGVLGTLISVVGTLTGGG